MITLLNLSGFVKIMQCKLIDYIDTKNIEFGIRFPPESLLITNQDNAD
jgi:hypothetical protein